MFTTILAVFLFAALASPPSDTVDEIGVSVERHPAVLSPPATCKGQLHVFVGRWILPAPINLGRTSLAAVLASSVNGGQEQDSPFYGVLNAFDDGENWINNLNYTYWLSANEPVPWIEISFDRPVTLAAVYVDSPASFNVQAFEAGCGEYIFTSCPELLIMERPLPGIMRMRIHFHRPDPDDWRPLKVAEVRVLGYPDSAGFAAPRRPRVFGTSPPEPAGDSSR
jgi:hypothetical protein